MMTDSYKILLAICLVLLLCACNRGVSQSSSDNVVVLPQQNQAIDETPSVLNEQQLDILSLIKRRVAEDGAAYQFDNMTPVFEQAGDKMNVSFEFIDPNTVGGSPMVEYSLSQSEITNVVYTQ